MQLLRRRLLPRMPMLSSLPAVWPVATRSSPRFSGVIILFVMGHALAVHRELLLVVKHGLLEFHGADPVRLRVPAPSMVRRCLVACLQWLGNWFGTQLMEASPAGLSFFARGFVTYQACTDLPASRRLNITRAKVVAVARETMRPRIIAAATRGNGPIEERLVAFRAWTGHTQFPQHTMADISCLFPMVLTHPLAPACFCFFARFRFFKSICSHGGPEPMG